MHCLPRSPPKKRFSLPMFSVTSSSMYDSLSLLLVEPLDILRRMILRPPIFLILCLIFSLPFNLIRLLLDVEPLIRIILDDETPLAPALILMPIRLPVPIPILEDEELLEPPAEPFIPIPILPLVPTPMPIRPYKGLKESLWWVCILVYGHVLYDLFQNVN